MLKKFVSTNSSEAEVIQQLDNLCNLLPLFGAQCEAIVNEYAPQLIQWILNKENPQEFCTQVGLCSSAVAQKEHNHHKAHLSHKGHKGHKQMKSAKRSVEGEDQAVCSICTMVATYVEQWVAQNQTEAQIIAQLQSFCTNLGPLAPECNSFVATYAPQIISWAEKKETPQVICQQIGACTTARKLVRANAVKQLQRSDKRSEEQGVCQVCELVVTYVEQLISQNNTVNEIEQKVDAMCALLPSPLNGVCVNLVNQYLPQLIQWILSKEDPTNFCTSVNLC